MADDYTKEDWDPPPQPPDIPRDWSLPPNLPGDWSPNLEDRRGDRYAPLGMNEALGLPPAPNRPGNLEPMRGYHPTVSAADREYLRPYDYPVYYDKYLGLPDPTDPQYRQATPPSPDMAQMRDLARNMPGGGGATPGAPQFASTPAAPASTSQPAYEPGGSPLPPGASRSYRNNNPGNLVYSPFSARHGAIGKDAQGFAIFPSPEDGANAQAALWQTQRYADQPLGAAVKGWGGLYGKQLGIDPSLSYSQLPPEQQQAILARQKQMEGWIPPAGMRGPAALPDTMPAALPPGGMRLTPVTGDPFADQIMGPEGG